MPIPKPRPKRDTQLSPLGDWVGEPVAPGVAAGYQGINRRMSGMAGGADQRGVIRPVTTEDPMDPDSGLITRPKFRMWLRSDGIVQLVWAPRVAMGLEDALAATEAMAKLTGGRQSALLVDAHDVGPQDRPARSEFARRGDLVSAVALIVGTPLSRMMGNFFLAVSRPMAPTRLFDDEVSALAWLQGFVG
jgi:hypothetical protein